MTREDPRPAPRAGHWLPTGCLGIGSVGTGSLAYAHAHGWVIAIVVAVSAVCALLAALVPQESQHKVDWWRLLLEHRAGRRTSSAPQESSGSGEPAAAARRRRSTRRTAGSPGGGAP